MKNFADEVVDEVKSGVDLVKKELREQYKRTKPFRKEKIDPAEEYFQYKILTQHPDRMRIMGEHIGPHGESAVNTWLYDMDKYEQRRRNAAR